MEVGKKGGGKHWTKDEIERREEAAQAYQRADDATLTPPDWLSDGAIAIWEKKLAEIAGLNAGTELLDALDSEILATYCDAVHNYAELSKVQNKSADTYKVMQAYNRIILAQADKLGFTPAARNRLIKVRADENKNVDEFGDKFD